MKLFSTLLSVMLFYCITISAQVSKTVNVVTAGTLNTLFSDNEKNTITNLILTGNIDARDFKFMQNNLTALSVLDISNVMISGYNGTDGPSSSNLPGYPNYPANEIPASSFINNATLTTISLPVSVSSIGFLAFKNINKLQTITIPQNINLIYSDAFSDCINLKTVRFLSATPPSFSTYSSFAFGKRSSSGNVYIAADLIVPVGSINAYKSSDYWLLKSTTTKIYEDKLTVGTSIASSMTATGALLNGNISYITESPVTSHGFCWNSSGNPSVNDNKYDKGIASSIGAYTYAVSNLTPGTKYYVRAYATDGERTSDGEEVQFTTASLPASAGNISGNSTICQGQTYVTYSVAAINNATSYNWTLPTGVTGTSTTNSITVSFSKSAQSGNILVKGVNQWGDGASSSLSIKVNQLPAEAGSITGSTSVCQGENNVTYTVPVIANAKSYSWTLPTGVTGSSTTNSITVSFSKSAISGNITTKGVNDCGYGVASSLPISVNQVPAITISDKTLTCGDSVSLNATTNYNGPGTLCYLWSPAEGLSNANIANPACSANKDMTYTLTVTTPTGCTASKSLTVKIIAMDKPTLGIVGVGSNNKNRLAWNKAVSKGIAVYNIYRETKAKDIYEKISSVPYDSLSVFTDSLSVPEIKSNKYGLSIVDKAGLESELSTTHKTMHLSINKGQNSIWNLIWEPYEGFNVVTYNIYRGTSTSTLGFIDAVSGSSTQYTDLYAPSSDVYYMVEVISPILINPTRGSSNLKSIEQSTMVSYNSSRSNIATNIASSINETQTEDDKIQLYPNPVKTEFKVNYQHAASYEVLNLMGQVLFSGELEKSNTVNVGSLISGSYLIRFKTNNLIIIKKFIKE